MTISRRLEESLLENGKEALYRYLVEVILKLQTTFSQIQKKQRRELIEPWAEKY